MIKQNTRLEFTRGNKKLPKSTYILNMGSATDRPSAKRGLCQLCDVKNCYALKAERIYPQVLPYRRRQAQAWRSLSPEAIAQALIDTSNRSRKVKMKFLRFSEAGDFESQADVNKMSRVADLLKPYGVRVYGYTARRDLDFSRVSDNMTVNGSAFMAHNRFEAVKQYTSKVRCPGDCRTCRICAEPRNVTVQVLMH